MTDHADRQPRRSVGSQAIFMVGASAFSQVATAVIYLFGARSTNVADFGLVVAAIALGTAAVGFIDFGSNAFWVREFATSRIDPRRLGALAGSKLAIATGAAFLGGSTLFLAAPESVLWTAAPIAVALLLSQTTQVALRGIARAEIVAFAVLVDRAVCLVLLGVALALEVEVASAMWVMFTVGPLVSAAVCIAMTPRSIRPKYTVRAIYNPWRGARYYGFSSLATTAQSLDVTLLAAIGGATAAGLYGAVSRWVQPLSVLAGSFASVSVPYMARASNLQEGWAHAKKAAWLLGLAILGCFVLLAGAPLAVDLLLGSAYAESVPILQLLAIGAIPAVLNQPAASFLQAMKHDRVVSGIVAIGIGLQLLLLVVLSAFYGAMGAAASLAVAQTLMLVGFVALLARSLRY